MLLIRQKRLKFSQVSQKRLFIETYGTVPVSERTGVNLFQKNHPKGAFSNGKPVFKN